jgi:hypothetical protein
MRQQVWYVGWIKIGPAWRSALAPTSLPIKVRLPKPFVANVGQKVQEKCPSFDGFIPLMGQTGSPVRYCVG